MLINGHNGLKHSNKERAECNTNSHNAQYQLQLRVKSHPITS